MDWVNIVLPIITLILGGVVTYFFDQLKGRGQRKQLEQEQRLLFYQQLKFYLDASQDAFINQCIARDRLFKLLQDNHGPLPELEYEPLFKEYYTKLNEEEKTLFQLIREMTKTSIYKQNKAIIDFLQSNAKYYHELPELRKLNEHLQYWVSKYQSTIDTRDDVCLVYVGVAEEKPFPHGIDEKVSRIIKEISG